MPPQALGLQQLRPPDAQHHPPEQAGAQAFRLFFLLPATLKPSAEVPAGMKASAGVCAASPSPMGSTGAICTLAHCLAGAGAGAGAARAPAAGLGGATTLSALQQSTQHADISSQWWRGLLCV